MFKSTFNKGFELAFENGVTISVQWGVGNNCSNRNSNKELMESMKDEHAMSFTSTTAEVLIKKGVQNLTTEFAKNINMPISGGVCGWLNTDQVAEAIEWAKNYT